MGKITSTQKIVRHEHGTPNPVIAEEEKSLLAIVDRALKSTSNSQTIGRNGEVPLRNFLERYLPFTLRAATGHFIPSSGRLSPQIDVMILDARYPLLAQNADGSVLALLHSVVHTIEVKTRLTTTNMAIAWNNAAKIMSLASEVTGYGEGHGSIRTSAFAYRSRNSLDAIEDKYSHLEDPENTGLDIYIMRLADRDQTGSKPLGVELHFEPTFESENSHIETGVTPTCRASYTPLSDLYYWIVQDSYYRLAARNQSFSSIGEDVMNYLSWATCTWDEYFAEKEKERLARSG